MNFDLFFQLIKFAPQLKILQIGNIEDIASNLSKKLQECNGSLDLITDKEIEINSPKVKKIIKDYNSDFSINSREYENIIICDIDTKVDDMKSLLTECYHALENSAEIAIVIPNDSMRVWKLKELLDLVEYRAVNDIDMGDISIVTGKKLHMWGNGL
jgi:hypothetical protein